MEKRMKKIADVSEDIANLKFSSEDIANIEKGAVQDVKNAIKYAYDYYENLSDGPEKIYDDDIVKTVEEYFEDYDAYNMADAIEKAVAKYFPDTALAITDSIVCDQHLLSDKIFGKDYNYESVGKFVSEFGDEGWAELDADPQEIADKYNAEQETKDGISQRKEEEEEYYRSRGI